MRNKVIKKKKILFPSPEDAAQCLSARKRSKRGEYLSPGDSALCVKMFRLFPEWYHKTEVEVFNDTLPFGSTARRRKE